MNNVLFDSDSEMQEHAYEAVLELSKLTELI
jgi:hypothetical protein